jgi:hypothetical protein
MPAGSQQKAIGSPAQKPVISAPAGPGQPTFNTCMRSANMLLIDRFGPGC